MPKKILIAILFFSAVNFSLAQQSTIGKLQDEFERAKNDSLRLIHLFNLSRYYAETIPDSSYEFAERQLSIARNLDLKIEQVVALRQMGYALMNMGNYPRALQTLLPAIA